MAFSDILDRHSSCEVVIIPRFHKNRPRLIHGLYCANHCKLIKWLNPEESDVLVDSGVEKLEPVALDKMKLKIQQEWTPTVLPRRSSWI
jgi:hypothetical protein